MLNWSTLEIPKLKGYQLINSSVLSVQSASQLFEKVSLNVQDLISLCPKIEAKKHFKGYGLETPAHIIILLATESIY